MPARDQNRPQRDGAGPARPEQGRRVPPDPEPVLHDRRDNLSYMIPQPYNPAGVFVSRRRPVSRTEIEATRSLAKDFADSLDSTHIVLALDDQATYRAFRLAFSGGFNRRFAQRYMPVRNKYAQVVDQDWMVWICGWHAESMCLQGCRWRSYALEKCLEAGDRLVVEILEETDEVVTLRAHIFRVVPIPRGLTGYDAHGCPPGTVRMMYIIRDPIETPFPRQPRLFIPLSTTSWLVLQPSAEVEAVE